MQNNLNKGDCGTVKESEKKRCRWYAEVDYDEYKRSGKIVYLQQGGSDLLIDDKSIASNVLGRIKDSGFQCVRDEIQKRAYSILGARGRVLAYLFFNKDVKTNVLTTSIKSISRECEVSIQSATDALAYFEKWGLISVQVSGWDRIIFVNPGIGRKGNGFRENKLLEEMEKFDKEAKRARKQKEDQESCGN